MSLPKISILTPFKDTQQYIGECIKSVINQSYSNWELLLVNDNSEDNSLKIANNFLRMEDRIKVFQNEGKGIIAALRTAYKHSSGNFITRMDSDDIMAEDKLSIMFHQLQNSGKGYIALGLVKYFGEKRINDGYKRYENWLNRLIKSGNNFNEIYKECVIPSPCWMVHKTDLDKCGGFNPNLYPEDYDLAFRFYKHGLKCLVADKLLHFWRDYPTRTSRTHKHYAHNYFLDIKMKYFLELDYNAKRPLTVWGAGFKGKYIAKTLKKFGISFYWICNNPKKIEKKIYGVKLQNFESLKELNNPQCIVTVANSQSQKVIRNYFEQHQFVSMKDYFFFC
ncbi:glycosyltransferase family 2 protein [Aegicerativicinus sediminis]|uniref:glycosyltransferase family 2 protein n=1 Tax=Aegicerativicinus sediminis TaxID=2893202 RepID=UPI001E59BC51|nr:glycosyltransferase family 2 protein [Aegicerativicinus sediminis]